MRTSLLALGWLLAVSPVGAEPGATSVMLAAHPVPTVGPASVDLVMLNRGANPETFAPSENLAGEFIVGDRSWPVGLVAEPASARRTIAPAGFGLQSYRFSVPAGVPSGRVILEVRVGGFPNVQAALDLRPTGPTSADRAATPPQRPTTNLARARPAAAALRRTFTDRLGAHEPVYFIYGTRAPGAKFQVSFKYKLLDFAGLGEQSMARTLQFAFTQRSLWDVAGVSSPFYDTSYMPEIMYESLAPAPEASDRWFTWLGFQAAFKHESNGRAGPLSRSLNVVYARGVFALGQLDGWHLLVMPEVFTYVDNLEDNPDLGNYRGNGKLHLIFGRNDGPSLMGTTWAGNDFNHASVQFDLTLPIRTRLLNFETYLLVQYFNGYGESLLSYRDHSEAVRAGISLVR